MRYFISYSRKDAKFVKELYASLKLANIDVWLDTDEIRAGENWADRIQRGLEECNAMILVISPDSMASRHVSDEWQYYLNHEKPKKIYPVRIKPANIHFQLHPLNYVDFVGGDYQNAVSALIKELTPVDSVIRQTEHLTSKLQESPDEPKAAAIKPEPNPEIPKQIINPLEKKLPDIIVHKSSGQIAVLESEQKARALSSLDSVSPSPNTDVQNRFVVFFVWASIITITIVTIFLLMNPFLSK